MHDEELLIQPRLRIYVLLAAVFAVLLLLVVQLIRWQVIAPLNSETVLAQAPVVSNERGRGNIVDRNGHLLGTTAFNWEIGATPHLVQKHEEIASELSRILNLPQEKILHDLRSDRTYVLIERRAPQLAGEEILGKRWAGIHARPWPRRFYPQGQLAAHVLGFVNEDQQGTYGVEAYYNDFLPAQGPPLLPGQEYGNLREVLDLDIYSFIPSPAGRDLVLTLDRTIQWHMEKELAGAIEFYEAERGTILVMDPKTGGILAMANWPTYDPNSYFHAPLQYHVNPAVTEHYEAGSIFKIFTLAAALDRGTITPNSVYTDTGRIEVGQRVILNASRGAYGPVTATDILVRSLNVGTAQIAVDLGAQHFYNYMRRFGFSRLTEIDLAGETVGIMKTPGHILWSLSDLGTNSFGQGLAATPIQIVAAAAAIANDGVLMQSHVVSHIVDRGRVMHIPPTPVRRVISSQTADQITEMMVTAVEQGAFRARVPGYRIAGKTGTAQIPSPTGYEEGVTITSFIGFAPADDPQFVVLVKLERPKRDVWAENTAAVVFGRVAHLLFELLDIPPSSTR